jgi:predicted Zn-dependent protease
MKNLTKSILMLLLAMVVVGTAGWFGRKFYRHVVGGRLVAQARGYMTRKDFPNAELCLHRALQINPVSTAANEAVADLFEERGSRLSLEWRKRVVQLQPTNPTNRLALAETALKFSDLKAAAQSLQGVTGQFTNGVTYYKLQGALAWAEGNNGRADKYYAEALRLEPTNLVSRLNLATIHIAFTDAAVADSARKSLEDLTTNSACRLTALRYLTADAVVHKSLARAVKFSALIVEDSNASAADKIDHLQLLRSADTNAFLAWLSTLRTESTSSPVSAFALAKWMITAEGSTNCLRWLQSLPLSVQTNQPVPLIVTDCQIALQDWVGILALVTTEDWGEGNYYRLALQSRAEHALGKEYTFKTTWNKSVRCSTQRLDRLSRLAQLSAEWGWKSERAEVLREIVTQFPKARWASAQLMDQLYAEGNTQELKQLLSKIYPEEPSNPRLKNAFANVSLLRKTELERAYRLSREAYDSLPDDPFVVSTYSYSLLLQHKPDEALKAFSKLKPEALKIPEIAGYYGVVQAESGHKDLAKEPLELAEAANLLPEEKELVRLAKSGL